VISQRLRSSNSAIVLFPDPELALGVEEPSLRILVADVFAVGPEISALGVLETKIVAIFAEISLRRFTSKQP